MTPRPCLRCGAPTNRAPAYCDRCNAENNAAKKQGQPQYAGPWEAMSRRVRRQWLETYGPLCPGFARPAHLVTPSDLVVDHLVARDPSTVQVLCRSCNSTKAAGERPR